MSLTDKELAEIREREKQASPGPWYVEGGTGSILAEHPMLPSVPEIVAGHWRDYGVIDPDNADFIAHARDDIPALLVEVDMLRTENAALRKLARGVANIQIPPDERCQACHSAQNHRATCPILNARGLGY